MYSEKQVKAYMRRAVSEHVDSRTGEVNASELCVDAADEFNVGHDIPEDISDWAVEIANWYERSQ